MTILLTGGLGYIGSQMAHYLVRKGENVVILDNLSSVGAIPDERCPDGVPFIIEDIGNVTEKLLENFGVTEVMHFAAFKEAEVSVVEPEKYYENNVSQFIKLLGAIQRYGKVTASIFSSSCAVYGEPKPRNVDDKWINKYAVKENQEAGNLEEPTPLNPNNPYGKSKLMGELAFESFATIDSPGISLRYFNVCGADPEFKTGPDRGAKDLITRLVDCARTGEEFTIFGSDYVTKDGTAIRDYVHVWDLCRAHHTALLRIRNLKGSDAFYTNFYPYEVYNLGYGKGFSVQEMVSRVSQKLDKPILVKYGSRRPGDITQIWAEARKWSYVRIHEQSTKVEDEFGPLNKLQIRGLDQAIADTNMFRNVQAF